MDSSFGDFVVLLRIRPDCSCLCLFFSVALRDVPGPSQLGSTPSPRFPAVGGLFSSSDCRGPSFFDTWGSIRGIWPRWFGMGLRVSFSAPPPQLPRRQPLQEGDPRRARQLHPAVLAAALLRHLLGGHRRARGVRQVSPPRPAEQGRAAGCVCLQRRGGRSGLLRASGPTGGAGDPIGPPGCRGDNRNYGEGFCVSGGE